MLQIRSCISRGFGADLSMGINLWSNPQLRIRNVKIPLVFWPMDKISLERNHSPYNPKIFFLLPSALVKILYVEWLLFAHQLGLHNILQRWSTIRKHGVFPPETAPYFSVGYVWVLQLSSIEVNTAELHYCLPCGQMWHHCGKKAAMFF